MTYNAGNTIICVSHYTNVSAWTDQNLDYQENQTNFT